jgi:hypothetical protein
MLTVLPVSHQNGLVLPGVRTFTVLLIIQPRSYKRAAIGEFERTFAMSLVVLEFPKVSASVPILKTGTRTSHLIVYEATFVSCAIRPRVSTGASLLIIYPITFVCEFAEALLPRHFAIS